MRHLRYLLAGLIICVTSFSIVGQAQQADYRTTYSADGLYLTVELLDEDLAHFELNFSPPDDAPIWTSPPEVWVR